MRFLISLSKMWLSFSIQLISNADKENEREKVWGGILACFSFLLNDSLTVHTPHNRGVCLSSLPPSVQLCIGVLD